MGQKGTIVMSLNQTSARVPSFFDAANAGRWDYRPNIPMIFDETQQWRAANSVRPAAADKKKIHLLPIDAQRDFCHPEGTLFVGGRSGTGAIDDSRRLAEFIYRNALVITKITPTFDTHVPFQIFSRAFWEDEKGVAPPAFTVISADDIRRGKYRPTIAAAWAAANGNMPWLLKQVIHYCETLEKGGKYMLIVWPEHCLLGSIGHTLVGVIEEAVAFHSYLRGAQPGFEIKGGNPLTENYSVLAPEVLTRWDSGGAIGQRNVNFIETLLEADYVVIAGQAASHCVKSSIDDLLAEILAKDPALAQKVYVMEDCMSSVTVPDGQGGFHADYTPEAEDALRRYAANGMHLVKSTDPIDTWPDLVL